MHALASRGGWTERGEWVAVPYVDENLFNQATAMNYSQFEVFSPVKVTEAEYLQGVDIQRLIKGQEIERDPRFLMDKDHQPRRSIRLGARISF